MAVKLAVAELPGGRQFVFEQDSPATGEYAAALGFAGAAHKSGEPVEFAKALDTIRDAAGLLLETLVGLPQAPAECELSFGVKLSSEAGVLLAKAGAEANFTITLTWKAQDG